MRAGILPSMQAKLPGRKAFGRRFVNWVRERIGHGVKAIEDRALMDFLAEQQIGIESCLTSNIQTSTVAELAAHPLKTFLEHGIRASINTDDPGVQGVDIISRIPLPRQLLGYPASNPPGTD
ncbi:hypothetical protein [Escherichia coli]|uniref:hypothetical protein n=1 Tax=Escherichia coli TaxID=562 RepID=UPI0039DF54D2